MLGETGGGAGMPALDLLEGEGLRLVEKVDEGIGPGGDDADDLARAGAGDFNRTLSLDVIEESLKDSP
jgi:hypothetical protein